MASVDQYYQYERLNHGGIRLLLIEPGSWSDEPRCVLFKTSLWQYVAATPTYEALSYVWGSEYETQPLRCGVTSEVDVTENCMLAIRRLRRERESCIVWIDAVCIDQMNSDEKAAQVALMPKIYARATRVIVYLGEEYENSRLALDMISEMTSCKDINLELLPVIHNHWSSNDALAQIGYEAAALLIKRPWFSRIWVVQEVVRAFKAIVICGDRSIDWKHFSSFWRLSFTMTSSGKLLSPYLPMERPSIFDLTLLGPQSESSAGVIRFLQALRDREATDLRDKVFAVYGLVDGTLPAAYAVDYGKWVTEIYYGIAVYALSRFGALAILPAVQGGIYKLPSWVPDWSGMPTRSFLCDLRQFNLQVESGYKAGGKNADSGVRYNISDLQSGKLITLGINLGIMTELASAYDADDFDGNDVIDEWTQLSRRQWPKEAGDDQDQLIGDEWDAEWQFLLAISGDLSVSNQMRPRSTTWRRYFLWRHFYLGEDVEYLSDLHDSLADMNHDGEQNVVDPDEDELEHDEARNTGNQEAFGEGQRANETADSCRRLSEDFSEHLKFYISHARRQANIFRRATSRLPGDQQDDVELRRRHKADFVSAEDFQKQVAVVCHQRRYFIAHTGYRGICPAETEPGDSLWILKGGPVPYVLRPSTRQEDTFELVGEAYCQNVMWGEVLTSMVRQGGNENGQNHQGETPSKRSWNKVVLT